MSQINGRENKHLLLQAKLNPPQSFRPLVQRAFLKEWMQAARPARLVLVRAPAGFGKTTLMVQWLRRLQEQGRSTAWLGLDEGDNDPGRFLLYLDRAIRQKISPLDYGIPTLESVGARGPLAGKVLYFIDRIAAIPGTLTIFLDDLGCIDSPEVLEILQKVLQSLPSGKQFVLALRQMPELNLEGLRERGELLEIDMAKLRFSIEETGEFVRRTQDLVCSEEEVASLHRSTEGWVAGLQLSTLSRGWREHPEGHGQPFAGGFSRITEYLAEDVLASQPEEVRNFLVQTSILDGLCAPICNALTGRTDSGEMLQHLERENLFLIPLDKDRCWYRYHSLFARFLRNHLKRGTRERTVNLHRAASAWHAAEGNLLDAIRYVLAAGDAERAAELMERCAVDLLRAGQLTTVVEWGDGLSLPVLDRHPELQIAYGFALVVSQRYEKAGEILTYLELNGEQHSEAVVSRDDVTALKALLLNCQDRVKESEALVFEETTNRTDGGFAGHLVWLNLVGGLRMGRGKFSEVSDCIAQGELLAAQTRDQVGGAYNKALAAALEFTQGKRQEAELRLQSVLSEMGSGPCRYSDGGAMAAVLLGEILYEADRLDEAESLLEAYLPVMPIWTPPDVTIIALRTLARIRFARGDSRAAIGHLTQLKRFSAGAGILRAVASARLEEVRMALQCGDLDGANRIVKSHDDEVIWQSYEGWCLLGNDPETPVIGRLRLKVASGDAREALPELKSELGRAEHSLRFRQVLLIRILIAAALESCGERERAMRFAREAVLAAQGEGFVRVFADSGRPIPQLIHALRREAVSQAPHSSDGVSIEFLDRLLSALGESALGIQELEPDSKPTLLEPMTERELEILEMLKGGASNHGLADALSISVNTVRYHLRNINEKIGSNNRTQAIAFARSLGLVR